MTLHLQRSGGRPTRVLIVDDIEDNCVLLDRNLKRHGFATTLCTSGVEALSIISSHAPDIVLLDWMMPDLSGIDTLAAIREHFDARRLPVIMCTAVDEEMSVAAAIAAGANDYVVKPISMPILLARMRAHLEVKETVSALDAEKMQLEETLARRTRDLLSGNRG